MFLVRNERLKLVATYLNGIAIASAAIGGIGPVVNVGSGIAFGTAAVWIFVSLALRGVGYLFITRLRE